MSSLKLLIVFCAILTVCYCDSTKKKKHKYDLYWHGFHYLTFLALKFKAILVLGSIFTIGLLAGKIFAVIKLAEYMKKSHNDDHSGKIVYINPHGSGSDHPPFDGFSPPSSVYGKSNTGGYHDSFPPGFSVDQPPPGAQVSNVGNFNGPGQMYGSGGHTPGFDQAYGPPHGYGRSSTIKGHSIYDHFKMFKDVIKSFNITDMAFNDMNLNSDKCRRKFVCEVDFKSKNSILLKSAFDMFSDANYERYKTRNNITSLDECNQLYPNCIEVT